MRRAVPLLKDCAFNIDFHLMPNQPGSTPAKDLAMMANLLFSDELQADQWKLYPMQTVPWTLISRSGASAEGTSPISLSSCCSGSRRACRRGSGSTASPSTFPNTASAPTTLWTNLCQVLHKRMKQRDLRCRCICCREIGAFFCEQNGNRQHKKGSRNGKVKKSSRSRKRKRHNRKKNTQS